MDLNQVKEIVERNKTITNTPVQIELQRQLSSMTYDRSAVAIILNLQEKLKEAIFKENIKDKSEKSILEKGMIECRRQRNELASRKPTLTPYEQIFGNKKKIQDFQDDINKQDDALKELFRDILEQLPYYDSLQGGRRTRRMLKKRIKRTRLH